MVNISTEFKLSTFFALLMRNLTGEQMERRTATYNGGGLQKKDKLTDSGGSD